MKKGFTLLEMIFVLTVISIIFLLTIPNIQKVLDIANNKACDAQLKVVDSAILQYRLIYDEEATSITDLINEVLISDQQSECANHKSIEISDGVSYVN